MKNHWKARGRWMLIFGLLALTTGLPARGEAESPEAGNPRAALDSALAGLAAARQRGPLDIPVAGQAVLQLPSGYSFVPRAQTKTLLEAMGNRGAESVQGMIIPNNDESFSWFIVVGFVDAGYIKDDDAKDWKSEDILESIRKGTEEANEERRRIGIPEIQVIGWVEPPTYDPDAHRLVWSISSKLIGAGDDAEQGVNYNTLALGRHGYISMNLVTDANSIEQLKPIARNLLASLDFEAGKRYADFQPESDKVAEYGLAALVAGVAAKKLGLFALAAAFIAKFAKVIIAAGLVGLGGLGKLFSKKKSVSLDKKDGE